MTKWMAGRPKHAECCTYLQISAVYLQNYHKCLDNNVDVLLTVILCMTVYWQIMADIQHLLGGNTIPDVVKGHYRSAIKYSNWFK